MTILTNGFLFAVLAEEGKQTPHRIIYTVDHDTAYSLKRHYGNTHHTTTNNDADD